MAAKKKRTVTGDSVLWWALALSCLLHACAIFLIPSIQILPSENPYIEVEPIQFESEETLRNQDISEFAARQTESPLTENSQQHPELGVVPTKFETVALSESRVIPAVESNLSGENAREQEPFTPNQFKSPALSPELPPVEMANTTQEIEKAPPEALPEVPQTEPLPQSQSETQPAEQLSESVERPIESDTSKPNELEFPVVKLPDLAERASPTLDISMTFPEAQKKPQAITEPVIKPVTINTSLEKQPFLPEQLPSPVAVPADPTPALANLLPESSERLAENEPTPLASLPRLQPQKNTPFSISGQPGEQFQPSIALRSKRSVASAAPAIDAPPMPQDSVLTIKPTPQPTPALLATDSNPIQDPTIMAQMPVRPQQEDEQSATSPSEQGMLPSTHVKPTLGTASAPRPDVSIFPAARPPTKRPLVSDSHTIQSGEPAERPQFGVFVGKTTAASPETEPEATLQTNDALERAAAESQQEKADIEGPAAQRRVIDKPRSFPKLELDEAVDIRLKFWVLPDGTVGEVLPLQRGDVRLEQAAIAYLKNWRFNPVASDQPVVWGIIVIRYQLR